MNYPLICDPGTGYLKIGYSNSDFPSRSIPSVIGKPMLRSGEKISGVELKSIMVGDEVTPFRSVLELSYPISEGIVNNWDDMELIFGYSFKEMKVKPSETKLLLTEAIMNPLSNREKMAEIMFEKFGFNEITMQVQAILSLYAEGLTTSLLLDAGDGVTHLIPVYEGTILKPFVTRLNLAGRHMTSYLLNLLFLKGYSFNSSADFETVREIKEKLCFVSGDLEVDRMLGKETTTLDKEYRLPDGKKIRIGRERFEAPELMFQPWLGGFDFNGISESVFDCINKCPVDVRKDLYANVYISGGSTMFPGFPTRLEKDLNAFYKERILKGSDRTTSVRIGVTSSPNRIHNVFIGGCFFANTLKDMPDIWVTKREWEECGKTSLKKLGVATTM